MTLAGSCLTNVYLPYIYGVFANFSKNDILNNAFGYIDNKEQKHKSVMKENELLH